jgi:hypothetical protein
VTDEVTIGGLYIEAMSFGAATSLDSFYTTTVSKLALTVTYLIFSPMDGILGLAFDKLRAQGVATLMDALVLNLIQRISNFAGVQQSDPEQINRRQPSACR